MKSSKLFTRIFWLSSVSLITLSISNQTASAACTFVPTAGNDFYICDSGTAASLTDTGGNNSLTLPTGGTGQITGNVTFGAGTDSVIVNSGTIGGTVQQGSGIDDYRMSGGTIGSLAQGDGLDTFTMSGGHIIDFFEDGDNAVMTGGRIGRVNMKLDDNFYNMSGGTVDRNVVTGLGRDTIIISGGVIGGNISTSSGIDSVTVSGGSIGNGIKTGNDADTFAWSGGIIYNGIELEAGNDTATLTNLTNGNMGGMTLLSGGTGTDNLTFSNVTIDAVTRFQGWENVSLTNDTELRFESNLCLAMPVRGLVHSTLILQARSLPVIQIRVFRRFRRANWSMSSIPDVSTCRTATTVKPTASPSPATIPAIMVSCSLILSSAMMLRGPISWLFPVARRAALQA